MPTPLPLQSALVVGAPLPHHRCGALLQLRRLLYRASCAQQKEDVLRIINVAHRFCWRLGARPSLHFCSSPASGANLALLCTMLDAVSQILPVRPRAPVIFLSPDCQWPRAWSDDPNRVPKCAPHNGCLRTRAYAPNVRASSGCQSLSPVCRRFRSRHQLQACTGYDARFLATALSNARS